MNHVNGRRIDDISDMCGAWGWRRRFFHGEEPSSTRVKVDCGYSSGRRCSSTGSSGRRWRRFFCGIKRKKVKNILPLDPAEEPSFAGERRTDSNAQKNLAFRGCPCLLAEEPAEPFSADYLSFSRKNLRNLLPQATSPSCGRTCGTFFLGPCFAVYWFFFLENYVWTTNLLILLVSFFYLFAITKCICIWEMRNCCLWYMNMQILYKANFWLMSLSCDLYILCGCLRL